MNKETTETSDPSLLSTDNLLTHINFSSQNY